MVRRRGLIKRQGRSSGYGWWWWWWGAYGDGWGLWWEGGGGEACRLPALQGNQFKVIRGDSHHHTRELGRLSRITQTPVDLEEGDGFIVEVTIQNYI